MPTFKTVSIRIYKKQTEAVAAAENMQTQGFAVEPVVKVTDSINWNDHTATPAIGQDATVPAWLVIGRKPTA